MRNNNKTHGGGSTIKLLRRAQNYSYHSPKTRPTLDSIFRYEFNDVRNNILSCFFQKKINFLVIFKMFSAVGMFETISTKKDFCYFWQIRLIQDRSNAHYIRFNPEWMPSNNVQQPLLIFYYSMRIILDLTPQIFEK